VNPVASTSGAILGGRERERFPWFLFFCVVLSFAAHAGSFLIFQVVYPQRVTVPPPPPQVQLLSPVAAQYSALMSWVDAEDPALVANAQSVRPAGLLDVPYRPSYSIQRTAPRTVPQAAVAVQFPAAKNPLAIIRSADEKPAATVPAPEPLPTRVTFSTPLAARALARAPEFGGTIQTAVPVEPSLFLIGVTDRGEIRFVFLQQSSGNSDLDAAGARSLKGASFVPDASPVVWGHATVAWGDDVLAQDLKSESPSRRASPGGAGGGNRK
jgi:hypothetical protein